MTDIVERLRRYAGGVCISTPAEMEAADEIECLRAKIAEMEKQEPVASVWRCDNGHIHGSCERTLPMGAKLYALPGAQKQEGAANAALLAAAPDLLEACETFAEWLGREEGGFARAGNKRDTPEGERAWRDWYNENLRLCALAQEQARAAIARATGEKK